VQTFELTLTQAEFDKAVATGLNPVSGTLPPSHGVTLSYVANGLLVTFTVVSKPFYVTPGMIESGVKNLLGIE
jgi:hypothetical protein